MELISLYKHLLGLRDRDGISSLSEAGRSSVPSDAQCPSSPLRAPSCSSSQILVLNVLSMPTPGLGSYKVVAHAQPLLLGPSTPAAIWPSLDGMAGIHSLGLRPFWPQALRIAAFTIAMCPAVPSKGHPLCRTPLLSPTPFSALP